jgi:hypothetical protein
VRYAVRYYERTEFFGHESDADVVITPAMAMIMPGVRPGAKIVHEPQLPAEEDPDPDLEPSAADDRAASHDDWGIEPELGAAGIPALEDPPTTDAKPEQPKATDSKPEQPKPTDSKPEDP